MIEILTVGGFMEDLLIWLSEGLLNGDVLGCIILFIGLLDFVIMAVLEEPNW